MSDFFAEATTADTEDEAQFEEAAQAQEDAGEELYASTVPPCFVNLLHYDQWHDVPEGWFEAFDRRIYGLAEHKHAFLFAGSVDPYNTDLVPLARIALKVFRDILGTVVLAPDEFPNETFALFSPTEAELPIRYFVPGNIAGDTANWLGHVATFPDNGRPTAERVLAVEALLAVLNVYPPIEPLDARIEACRTVARSLLKTEHREVLVNGGFRDVYALVERLAEETDAQLLSELCSASVRMLHPVAILDDIDSHHGASVAPPSALQIAAVSLQAKAHSTGAALEIPGELGAALGGSRAAQLCTEIGLSAIQEQAAAWVREVAPSEDHHLIRRWLAAAWELNVRVQRQAPDDEVFSIFEYEDLYNLYIASAGDGDDQGDPDEEADEETDDNGLETEDHVDDENQGATPDAESLGDDVDAILAELDAIVGQPELKQQVRQLVAQVRINKKREEHGRKSGQSAVHMVFSGPPGTGKTTVARIIGRLFHALGILPSGAFKEVDRTELVAAIIGGTEANTKQAIAEAMGGVLFIDEAYALVDGSENDFGKHAINTLLKALTDHRGEFVCIVAGYSDKMKKFLDSNPGMRSRFDRTITFAPYTAAELAEIAVSMARADDNHLDEGALDTLRIRLEDTERRGGFAAESWGNARDVGTIVAAAAAHRDLRISEAGLHDIDSIITITQADMSDACDGVLGGGAAAAQERAEDVLAELNQQIGQEQLKRQVRVLLANARAAQAQAAADGPAALPSIPHLIFTGPPGTGKTTIARILARLYKALGILPSGQVVEVDKGALVVGYIGQTAGKTTAKIDEAMGGVLFIDEAYALASRSENDFGKDAIETLLKRMEDDRGKFLVIAAGYPDEMQTFLQSNVGLSRRFPITIEFTPYSADELSRIADLMFTNAGQRLTHDGRAMLRARLEGAEQSGLFAQKDWGNGGSARNIVEEAVSARNLRVFGDPVATPSAEERVTVTDEDVAVACDKFLGVESAPGTE